MPERFFGLQRIRSTLPLADARYIYRHSFKFLCLIFLLGGEYWIQWGRDSFISFSWCWRGKYADDRWLLGPVVFVLILFVVELCKCNAGSCIQNIHMIKTIDFSKMFLHQGLRFLQNSSHQILAWQPLTCQSPLAVAAPCPHLTLLVHAQRSLLGNASARHGLGEGAIEQGQVLAMHLWLKRTTLSRTSVKRTALSHTFSNEKFLPVFSGWKFPNTSCSAVVSTSAGDICISSTVRMVSRSTSSYIFSVDREHATLIWISCWNYRWDRGIESWRDRSEYRRSWEEDSRRLNIQRKDHKSWSWRSRFCPFCFTEFGSLKVRRPPCTQKLNKRWPVGDRMSGITTAWSIAFKTTAAYSDLKSHQASQTQMKQPV